MLVKQGLTQGSIPQVRATGEGRFKCSGFHYPSPNITIEKKLYSVKVNKILCFLKSFSEARFHAAEADFKLILLSLRP